MIRQRYYLINKANIVLPISIDESVKEDFKELMNWNEEEFKKRTCTRYLKGSVKG